MSSPIKPPGKPPGSSPTSGAGAGGASESFDKALEEANAKQEVSEASSAVPSDAIAALARDVAGGKVEVAEAVDRLVARALEGPEASLLPPAQRAELEAHLRRALADDPTLRALTQDVESSG